MGRDTGDFHLVDRRSSAPVLLWWNMALCLPSTTFLQMASPTSDLWRAGKTRAQVLARERASVVQASNSSLAMLVQELRCNARGAQRGPSSKARRDYPSGVLCQENTVPKESSIPGGLHRANLLEPKTQWSFHHPLLSAQDYARLRHPLSQAIAKFATHNVQRPPAAKFMTLWSRRAKINLHLSKKKIMYIS